jgi:hypothetical protein
MPKEDAGASLRPSQSIGREEEAPPWISGLSLYRSIERYLEHAHHPEKAKNAMETENILTRQDCMVI